MQVYIPGILAATSVAAGQVVAVSIAVEPPGRQHAGITRGTFLHGSSAATLPDRSPPLPACPPG